MSPKQLASIPESLLKHQILKAMDYERVDEDWNKTFILGDNELVEFIAYRDTSAKGFIHHDGRGVSFYPIEELKPVAMWPAGTPTGDALRAYLRRWGWVPKAERQAGEEQANTKVII